MKILVTGATGFIGSHLVPALVKRGHKVRCLVRKTSNISKLKKLKNVKFFYGDITKPKTIAGIAKEIDIVFHLAATGHVAAISKTAYQSFREINVQGTKNLARECQNEKIKKFIHFSSTAAMGTIDGVADEKTECHPVTPYQKSKREAELLLLSLWRENYFPAVILRPCMVYGPGGFGEFYKFVKLMKLGIFPKVGRGENLTPMVYIDDVIQAAIKAMKYGKPGDVYIITSGKSYKMDQIRNEVMKNLGIKRPYLYLPEFLVKVGATAIEKISQLINVTPIVTRQNIVSTIANRCFDIAKAKNELQFTPEMSIETGIKKTIKWYQKEKKI